MLIHLKHFLGASIKKDCAHQRFEDVAENFGRFKKYNLTSVDKEVATERKLDKLVRFFLIYLN